MKKSLVYMQKKYLAFWQSRGSRGVGCEAADRPKLQSPRSPRAAASFASPRRLASAVSRPRPCLRYKTQATTPHRRVNLRTITATQPISLRPASFPSIHYPPNLAPSAPFPPRYPPHALYLHLLRLPVLNTPSCDSTDSPRTPYPFNISRASSTLSHPPSLPVVWPRCVPIHRCCSLPINRPSNHPPSASGSNVATIARSLHSLRQTAIEQPPMRPSIGANPHRTR